MQLPFDFSPEEFELADSALRKIRKELSLSLGCEIDLKGALLYWLKRGLETDPRSTPEGRIDHEESVYTILYRRCRDCHRSHVMTEDGPVDVPAEAVDRVESSAAKFEILPEEEVTPPASAAGKDAPEDVGGGKGEAKPQAAAGAEEEAPRDLPLDHPNTRPFLRRLFLRDGGRCTNPMCRRKLGLQGDHLQPWSEGGRTALWNECTLCRTCHSAKELGYLRVSGDPLGGFVFASRADAMASEIEEEGAAIDALPVVVPQFTYVNGAGVERRNGDAAAEADLDVFETCVEALRKLGSTKDSALSAARRGLEKLRAAGEALDVEALLKAALRG